MIQTSETKIRLPDGRWVRIERDQLFIEEGASYRPVGRPCPPRYYLDRDEITVERAGELLAAGGYPYRCENGVLVYKT